MTRTLADIIAHPIQTRATEQPIWTGEGAHASPARQRGLADGQRREGLTARSFDFAATLTATRRAMRSA